jgi:DNA-binding MarR family transcriptional regulator
MSSVKGSKLFRETIRILKHKLALMEDGELACCGVTFAQCHALVEIGRMQNISLSDLAQVMALDSSTLSRTVNSLVTGGFASRETDPGDRRFVTITLTEQGRRLCAGIEDALDEYYDRIFAQIPESKHSQILEDLILIIEAADRSGCC